MMLRAKYRLIVLAVLIPLAVGCGGPILRQQSPEAILEETAVPTTRFVSAYTHPYGMDYVKLEAVSLVTGLAGTGGDPAPTPKRAGLMAEMSRRQVESPNRILASPDTALVVIKGFLRPGIREGDRFDVEVRAPSTSDATSLRGGWVLSTRLSELAVVGEQVRKGHDYALAEGPVLIDPSADSKEKEALLTRGRILGGGVALKSRPLGLVISSQHQSERMSQEIANVINRRFHMYEGGVKKGVATAKTKEFVELKIHPRYKDNVTRFVKVVRNVALGESARAAQQRMLLLERQLNDPLTTATAALRLEALGSEQAIELLKERRVAEDPEIRFYAAEALAYLDDTAAVEPLAEAARNEPAFRVNALAALSAMDDVLSFEALRELLSVSSAETRYGAFRSLWAMNEHDNLVRGEQLENRFSLHVLNTEGPAMVHVTRSYRPEIVLFGKDQQFQLPLVLDAGPNILVNGMSGAKITISKFHTGADPEQRVVSTSVEDVIRAIVDLGGTYPDVVQALQQAKEDGALPSRFRVDALPEAGRRYATESDESTEPEPVNVSTPRPDLFSRR